VIDKVPDADRAPRRNGHAAPQCGTCYGNGEIWVARRTLNGPRSAKEACPECDGTGIASDEQDWPARRARAAADFTASPRKIRLAGTPGTPRASLRRQHAVRVHLPLEPAQRRSAGRCGARSPVLRVCPRRVRRDLGP
jgi:hypothetical protein